MTHSNLHPTAEGQKDQAWQGARVPARFARAMELGFVSTDSCWTGLLSEILGMLGLGVTIAVVGPHGSGRTTLGASVLYGASRIGRRGLYCLQRDALDVLGDPNAREEAGRLFNEPLLVLDNVESTVSEDESTMGHVIDVRHGARRDTLMLLTRSPLDGAELDHVTVHAHMGPDVAGKVFETGGVKSLQRVLRLPGGGV